MAQAVRQERDGGVTILVIGAPPVNALGAQVRAGLAEGLAAALGDPAVGAVVIRSEGAIFSAGADIREFGAPPVAGVPTLPELCDRIEASRKPVIVAVQGAALGGGMELALAAHVRLAAPEARFGLPEVALGLLPGAGGTQRTPRLIGAEAALRMMLGGRPVAADAAQAMGLVDAVVPDGLVETAVALAAEMAAEGRAPRRTRDRREGLADVPAYQAAVASARAGAGGRLPAPGRIVDCVDAAMLLPFDQGLAFERAAFEDLSASPESVGLRKAFLAERRAGRFPEAKAEARPVARVGIVGLAPAGAEVAAALAAAGLSVTVVELDSTALFAGLGRVAAVQERAVAAGQIAAPDRDAAWERIVPGTELSTLAACDLVIEALPEEEGSKTAVLTELGPLTKPGALMVSLVGWADPAVLAQASGSQGSMLGLGLGAAGGRSRLAEIAVPAGTAPERVATLAALMRRLDRLVIRRGPGVGGIGLRVMAAMRVAGELLLEEGATPGQVDGAMRAFGLVAGPFEAADAAGLAADWAERQRRTAMGLALPEGSDLADLLVEAGRIGREAGRGYFRHEGTKPEEDPEVAALLSALREAKGILARPVGRAEIQLRCLAAAANEGARLVGEGVALRPGDVDAAVVAGYGFPRWEGGPMAWADARGLIVLRADLHRFAAQAPLFWEVAPLIDALIHDGRALADADGR